MQRVSIQTKINSVQYKIVKKGQSSTKLPYRYGKSVTLKNGTIAKVYVKYNTMLGEKELKLPQIFVDTKAPTKLRLKKKKSGKEWMKLWAERFYSWNRNDYLS